MNRLRIVLLLSGIIVAIWAATYHSVLFASFFAPKFEQVRRNTYVQSDSYVQGKIQELQKFQIEYLKTQDPIVKIALAETIKYTASGISFNNLPQPLKTFILNLDQ